MQHGKHDSHTGTNTVTGNTYLLVSSNNLEGDAAYASLHDIREVVLSEDYFTEKNLLVLMHFQMLEELTVGVENTDVSYIANLKSLKRLFIHGKNYGFSFLGLENLVFLQSSYPPNISLRPLKGLKHLVIRDCRHKEFNWVQNLSGLVNLEKLELIDCYLPAQLNFSSPLQKLTELEIYLNPKPFRLQALQHCTSLEKLILSQCPHLLSKGDIPLLQSVKWLRLTDCGPIEDCSMFYDMPNLEVLIITGKSFFVNGDLSGMMGKLKHFGFEKKKHYSHKPEDFPSIFRN